MKRFEDKYSKFVDAVFEAAADYQRGSVMPWAVLELAMGRGRDEQGGRRIIKRLVRKLLTDRELIAIPVPNVGLRFLTDEEAAVEVPRRRQRRAYRQLGRGIRELRAVRDGHLSDAARLARVRQLQCMSAERRDVGRAYREIGSRRKTETHPIRKPTR